MTTFYFYSMGKYYAQWTFSANIGFWESECEHSIQHSRKGHLEFIMVVFATPHQLSGGDFFLHHIFSWLDIAT